MMTTDRRMKSEQLIKGQIVKLMVKLDSEDADRDPVYSALLRTGVHHLRWVLEE